MVPRGHRQGPLAMDSFPTPVSSSGDRIIPPVPPRTVMQPTFEEVSEPELLPVAPASQAQSSRDSDTSFSEEEPESPDVIDENAFKDMLRPERRAEMRKCLMEGEHVPRVSRKSASTYQPVDPAMLEIYVAKVDRIYRLNHFLTHSNLNVPHIVDLVTNGRVDQDSQEYKSLRTKLLENCRTFKNHTVDRCIAFIQMLMKNEPLTKDATDNNFQKHLVSKFTRENYYHCFYYIKGYIKFESPEMGQYFMKSKVLLFAQVPINYILTMITKLDIFVNMGVEVRRHINAGLTKDSRARLLDFYDTVALVEDHDDVDIDDFQQLSQRFHKEKSKKKRNLSEATAAFSSIGLKPKKTRPTQPVAIDPTDEGGPFRL